MTWTGEVTVHEMGHELLIVLEIDSVCFLSTLRSCSDASYADLPLPLLGAPVDIEALVKLGSRSLAKQDRD